MRSDKAWSSGKVEITQATGNVVEANLKEAKPNSFAIMTYDEKGNLLPCFPNEITIIQGTKLGAAPLPYNIGIAIWSDAKQKAVFRMAKGLEKNKPVPAKGVVNDLKTSNQLRPGVASDELKIPIYQTDDYKEAEGKIASLYEYVADVIITGDDVDSLVPEDSPIDVTLHVDSSEQMTLEVHFLASDMTVEKNLDTSKKQSIDEADDIIKKNLAEAERSIRRLKQDGIDTNDVQSAFEAVKTESQNSSEKKAVLQHVKEVLRKIEGLDESTEWQRVESELREEFAKLERTQNKFGNDKTAELVSQLRQQTDAVIRSKDVKMGRELIDQVSGLFFELSRLPHYMVWINDWNNRFNTIQWKDRSRARQLLNNAINEINNQPTVDSLHPFVVGLVDLLPNDDPTNPGPEGLAH